MAQSVGHRTLDLQSIVHRAPGWLSRLSQLDLGSGHDLTVHEFKTHVGLYADSVEPAWNSVSPFSVPSPHMHVGSLSLSLSK